MPDGRAHTPRAPIPRAPTDHRPHDVALRVAGEGLRRRDERVHALGQVVVLQRDVVDDGGRAVVAVVEAARGIAATGAAWRRRGAAGYVARARRRRGGATTLAERSSFGGGEKVRPHATRATTLCSLVISEDAAQRRARGAEGRRRRPQPLRRLVRAARVLVLVVGAREEDGGEASGRRGEQARVRRGVAEGVDLRQAGCATCVGDEAGGVAAPWSAMGPVVPPRPTAALRQSTRRALSASDGPAADTDRRTCHCAVGIATGPISVYRKRWPIAVLSIMSTKCDAASSCMHQPALAKTSRPSLTRPRTCGPRGAKWR